MGEPCLDHPSSRSRSRTRIGRSSSAGRAGCRPPEHSRSARIVLPAAEPGATNTDIPTALRTTKMIVAKRRGRFAARGARGLADEPRPGATHTIMDAQIEAVLTTTLEATLADGSRQVPQHARPRDRDQGPYRQHQRGSEVRRLDDDRR